MSKRACKVKPLYFGLNRRADPRTWEQAKKLIDYQVENERKVDPGMPVDLILVNNVIESTEAVDYLNSLNGQPTKTGTIKVLHRSNVGISFGAYNFGFENFKSEYDYWFFLEDDLFTNRDNYYKEFVNQLESDDSLAYVALVGIGDAGAGGDHAHNGAGCTSKKYLDFVYDNLGSLPYHNAGGALERFSSTFQQRQAFWKKHCKGGEVAFTNVYVDMGYKIKMFSGEKSFTRWIKGNSYDVDVSTWGRCDFIHDKPYDFM